MVNKQENIYTNIIVTVMNDKLLIFRYKYMFNTIN